jgi:hypothetical protein
MAKSVRWQSGPFRVYTPLAAVLLFPHLAQHAGQREKLHRMQTPKDSLSTISTPRTIGRRRFLGTLGAGAVGALVKKMLG